MKSSTKKFFQRWKLNRNEWAINHLHLTPSDAGEHEGLLLIQIDGLARSQLEKALATKRMPFLKHLLEKGDYSLKTFYPGLPSTTPAVQAELYYGIRAGVPAFSFLDREEGRLGTMFDTARVKKLESHFAEQANGLLEGGSSWSNIYSGGATLEESHFCISCIGLGELWRRGSLAKFLLFCFLQFPAVLRIFGLLMLELAIGISDAFFGILRGRNPLLECGMLLSRMGMGIAMREIVTIGGKVDVTRGLPVVHLNFLGYDELSHRRGPGSWFAHWSLEGIDRAIKGLHKAAMASTRRRYQVWIFSDHGQEATQPTGLIPGTDIRSIVKKCLDQENAGKTVFLAPRRLFGRPLSRRQATRHPFREPTSNEDDVGFMVAAMGPLGHLYLKTPWDDERKRALAIRLVKDGGVPGVLIRWSNGAVTWFDEKGEVAVPEEVPDYLEDHPSALRGEVAADLVNLCQNDNAGDLILLGWSAAGARKSFVPERGGHAGPGMEETQGFLLVPNKAPWAGNAGEFVRPEHLRSIALILLGRADIRKKCSSLEENQLFPVSAESDSPFTRPETACPTNPL